MIKFISYIVDEIHMKYINTCYLYFYKNNRQFVLDFQRLASVQSRCLKCTLQPLSSIKNGRKNKIYSLSWIIVIYSCQWVDISTVEWVGFWTNFHWTFLVIIWKVLDRFFNFIEKYIEEISIKCDAKKWKLSNYKNYYCFIPLEALDQFSGHDHTILINEYLRNFNVILSKYVV